MAQRRQRYCHAVSCMAYSTAPTVVLSECMVQRTLACTGGRPQPLPHPPVRSPTCGRSQIKCKQPHLQYSLYQERGCWYLILPCGRWLCYAWCWHSVWTYSPAMHCPVRTECMVLWAYDARSGANISAMWPHAGDAMSVLTYRTMALLWHVQY